MLFRKYCPLPFGTGITSCTVFLLPPDPAVFRNAQDEQYALSCGTRRVLTEVVHPKAHFIERLTAAIASREIHTSAGNLGSLVFPHASLSTMSARLHT